MTDEEFIETAMKYQEFRRDYNRRLAAANREYKHAIDVLYRESLEADSAYLDALAAWRKSKKERDNERIISDNEGSQGMRSAER